MKQKTLRSRELFGLQQQYFGYPAVRRGPCDVIGSWRGTWRRIQCVHYRYGDKLLSYIVFIDVTEYGIVSLCILF